MTCMKRQIHLQNLVQKDTEMMGFLRRCRVCGCFRGSFRLTAARELLHLRGQVKTILR